MADSSFLPPPPLPPPIITLDDREDGEVSGDEDESKLKHANGNHSQGSDVECIGDDLFDIDDDGVEVDDVEAEESFYALQQVACKDAKVLDISLNATETPKNTRRDGTCFNCLGPHTLGECTLPHDRKKIARNRNAFGSNRKERIVTDSGSRFTPGKLSKEAREALDLPDDEYYPWIYKMREAGPTRGYPPGYLKRLMNENKQLEFHSDDPLFSTATPKQEAPFNSDKIVFYDGFNLIDPRSDRERAARKLNRSQRWPAYTKETYAKELENYVFHLKERQTTELSTRKRHRYEENDSPQSKKAEAKAERRAREKADKNWIKHQLEEAEKKLIHDFKNTDFEKEPEKLHFIDKDYGIFASKKERKAIDRARSRRAESLEKEARWTKTMEDEEKARIAKSEKVEKEKAQAVAEKRASKAPPKSFDEKREAKRAEKKAAREYRDSMRLQVTPKPPRLVSIGTQTRTIKKIIYEDDEEEVIEVDLKVQSVQQQSQKITKSSEDKSNKLTAKIVDLQINDAPQRHPLSPESEDSSEIAFVESEPVNKKITLKTIEVNEHGKLITKTSEVPLISHSAVVTPHSHPGVALLNRATFEGENKSPTPNLHETTEAKSPREKKKPPLVFYSSKNISHSPRKNEAKSQGNKADSKKHKPEALMKQNGYQKDHTLAPNLNKEASEVPQSISSRKPKKSKGRNLKNEPPQAEEEYLGYDMTHSEAIILQSMAVELPISKPKIPKKSPKPKSNEPNAQSPANAQNKNNDSGNENKNEGRYSTSASGRPNSRNQASKPDEIPDTPASPELPPVVSRALTEDQAEPKGFLVAQVDDRRMPSTDNFAEGITPFQYDNLSKPTGMLDKISELIKARKKD